DACEGRHGHDPNDERTDYTTPAYRCTSLLSCHKWTRGECGYGRLAGKRMLDEVNPAIVEHPRLPLSDRTTPGRRPTRARRGLSRDLENGGIKSPSMRRRL